MSAVAQGMAGLALVMNFALLGTRRMQAASNLLAVQSLAVAISALAQHRPLIAAAAAVVDIIGAQWFINRQPFGLELKTPAPAAQRSAGSRRAKPPGCQTLQAADGLPVEPTWQSSVPAVWEPLGGRATRRTGRAKPGIIVGAGLAMLCQTCGPLAVPLAVVLLSILLAATWSDRWMRLVALVSLQNGLALAACSATLPPLSALACFILPLPFAAGISLAKTADRDLRILGWKHRWLGWVQLMVAIGLTALSLTIPLDPLASVFAPLIGVWGISDAWAARKRGARTLAQRWTALAKLVFMLVAVGTTQPAVAWVAVLGAVTATLFPVLRRRWNSVLLAYCSAGLSLLGLLAMPLGIPSVSYMALFTGYAAVTAVVPDLGVVIVVLILRLTMQPNMPSLAGTILTGLALMGLLVCAVLLTVGVGHPVSRISRNQATLMQLGQTSVAALALGIGLPEARFAAVVLLILLVLTLAGARIAHGPTAIAARAGFGGVPPFGVFPGLVLVLLVISREAPWLLLPFGLALAATIAAGIPRRSAPKPTPAWPWSAFRCAGLVPLALAFVFGFIAPERLVNWLHAITAGTP